MGALAKWGAVAGAAKGFAQGKQAEWDAEAETQKAEDEDRRKRAFERLQQKNRMELENLKQSGATERTGMQADASRDVAGIGAESRETVQGMRDQAAADERIWKSEENELDRQNRKEIAEIQAAARSSSTGAASEAMKAQLGRFQARTLTQEEANQYGITINKSQEAAIFDEIGATWYVQSGNKLFLAGDQDRKAKARPNQNHIKALYDNPYMSGQFYDKFGYLPEGYLQALMTHDLKQMSGGQ